MKTLAFFSNPRRALWPCAARPLIFLFAFAIFAVPSCRGDDAAIAAANDLVHKLAAQIDVKSGVTIDLGDLTGHMAPSDLAATLQAMKDQLRDLGAPANVPGVTVRVTLTEDPTERMWVADFARRDQPDKPAVLIVAFARAAQSPSATSEYPVQIEARPVYDQVAPILDFLILKQDHDAVTEVLVLGTNSLSISDRFSNGWQVTKRVDIPSNGTVSRDPRGVIELSPQGMGNVYTAGQKCQLVLQPQKFTLDCAATNVGLETHFSGPTAAGCGNDQVKFAAGTGDYTEQDHLQAFAITDASHAMSATVNMPGPVLALFGNPARAVVRNLATGKYEAYDIRVTCNH